MLSTTQVYNVQTHPELGQLQLSRVRLDWSGHALYRAHDKSVPVSDSIQVRPGQVVELERTGRLTTKLVIRLPLDQYNDQVLVLVPIQASSTKSGELVCRVLTVWLNRVGDTHRTLRHERLAG